MLHRLLTVYARLPEHPAKYRVMQWLGRSAFPEEGVVADVDGGVRMYLHPRDWIEYELLRGTLYEPCTREFLARNLRKSDNALLAGVNNGLHVICAARAVGPGGCVIGVEPQPAALLRARANIELNGLTGRVRLVAAALGNEETLTAMAWSSAGHAGTASLFDTGPGCLVVLLRLSTVIEKVSPGPLRLLLLDVQGYEVTALQGLDPNQLPELLIVEDDHEWLEKAGTSRRQLHDQMTGLGYQLHDLFGDAVNPEGALPLENNLVGVRGGAAVTWLPRP